MSKLSESVFYGRSNAVKSDNAFSELNKPNGATKILLRTMPRAIKTCEEQNDSKNIFVGKRNRTNSFSAKSSNDQVSKASFTPKVANTSSETDSKKAKLEATPLCHNAYELSDYEKQIQNNIAERVKFLEKLNIFDAKTSFEESVKIISSKPKTINKEKVVKIKSPNVRRKSLRLQHLEAEKLTPPIEIICEKKSENTSQPSPGPAYLQSYYNQENENESFMFLSRIKSFKNCVKDDVDSCWNKSAELTDNILGSYKSGENDVVKVVPSSVCSIAFHPSVDKSIAFVGGMRGELGIFDIENMDLKSSEESSFYYKTHCGTINSMTIDIINRNNLYTTSFEGVRKLDLSTFQSEQIYCSKKDTFVSWHSQQDHNHLLVAGSYGFIDHVDLRCTTSNVRHYKFTDNYRIKVVAVNPIQNQYFSTGGSDGSICLYDLRSMKKDLCNFNVGRSINGLEYSPITGKYILTTSYKDIRLFESPSPWEIKYKSKIRHNNFTGRWLRPFRASWLPLSEDLFVIGSMDNPRRIEIWNADGHLIHSIFGDSLHSVSCVNAFHPFKKILLGGNSSGKVHVFT